MGPQRHSLKYLAVLIPEVPPLKPQGKVTSGVVREGEVRDRQGGGVEVVGATWEGFLEAVPWVGRGTVVQAGRGGSSAPPLSC